MIPSEKLLEKVGSTYKLVNLAARRAMQLSEGEPPLVDLDSKKKPALVALQEISEGKISYRPKGKEKKD
jgi:DNA-directed RNA polymerase subunit omega